MLSYFTRYGQSYGIMWVILTDRSIVMRESFKVLVVGDVKSGLAPFLEGEGKGVFVNRTAEAMDLYFHGAEGIRGEFSCWEDCAGVYMGLEKHGDAYGFWYDGLARFSWAREVLGLLSKREGIPVFSLEKADWDLGAVRGLAREQGMLEYARAKEVLGGRSLSLFRDRCAELGFLEGVVSYYAGKEVLDLMAAGLLKGGEVADKFLLSEAEYLSKCELEAGVFDWLLCDGVLYPVERSSVRAVAVPALGKHASLGFGVEDYWKVLDGVSLSETLTVVDAFMGEDF